MPVIVDLDKRIEYSKQQQFTGILSIQSEGKMLWHLYFLAGQIVWANSKAHSQRSWRRQLLQHCPDLLQQYQNSKQPISYASLAKSVMRKNFSREKFSKLVTGYISEILFDILQQGTLNFRASRKLLAYKSNPREAANFPCIGLQDVQLWKQVKHSWQIWEQSNLIEIRPNQIPLITDSQKLREHTSPTVFRALTSLVDGKQTLRDLALRARQPLVPLTLSLLPHIQNNLIRMVDISTLNADIIVDSPKGANDPNVTTAVTKTSTAVTTSPKSALSTNSKSKSTTRRSTIIYIDDSPADSKQMGQIIQSTGYAYVNIADPLQALPRLLEVKPQLIFLDLVMPVANGYEICAQIRRISAFKTTPVVIVTNNDGIADRVRAKVVGASGFMGKPIQKQKVLKVLKSFLKPEKSTPSQLHGRAKLSTSG